jgi:hypothetical protein
VTETVVDILEVVQINEEQGRGLATGAPWCALEVRLISWWRLETGVPG